MFYFGSGQPRLYLDNEKAKQRKTKKRKFMVEFDHRPVMGTHVFPVMEDITNCFLALTDTFLVMFVTQISPITF